MPRAKRKGVQYSEARQIAIKAAVAAVKEYQYGVQQSDLAFLRQDCKSTAVLNYGTRN